MQNVSPWLLLWPGLRSLWSRGELSGLALAVTFAILLNSALIGAFLRPDWVSSFGAIVLWVAAGSLWFFSLWREATPAAAKPDSEREQAAFATRTSFLKRAQQAYLKGDWGGAEKMLLPQTRSDDFIDQEAQLLLASVYRRSGRIAEAEQLLSDLKHSAAHNWGNEIANERRRLQDA